MARRGVRSAMERTQVRDKAGCSTQQRHTAVVELEVWYEPPQQ